MTTDVTRTTVDYLEILQQTAIAYRVTHPSEPTSQRPKAASVVEALLQAEKAAKQQRLSYPLAPLLGQWRLCLATGTRKLRQRGGIALGKGFYLPRFTPAYIGFSDRSNASAPLSNSITISNQIQLGALKIRFTGPANYLGKKNILAFDFTHLHITLLGRSLYSSDIRGGKSKPETFEQQSIAKLPFFAFFLVTPDLIAARGRGGGLALWIREE
ncbi:hypothetical protein ACN4EK_14655 [Pantanalinema rosaneae CENA516]|uniref:hypothetical protein n=1 Tax=Pantanalinema rosaneae TaxID=1620701 RepID=UPI003D6E5EBE